MTMTAKTFIRLTILTVTLTAGVVLFSALRSKPQPAPTGEDGIQCREKCSGNRAESDNTEIWESISRHLLSTLQ